MPSSRGTISTCGRARAPNSATVRGLLSLFVCSTSVSIASHGQAQVIASGFASERFSPAPPASPWLTMDDLKLAGPLGGGVSLVTGYSRYPLRVALPGSPQRLNVVSDQAFVDVALAILFDRYRFTLNIPNPIYVAGQSGRLGGYTFTAPSVDLARYPDRVADVRFSLDSRIWGSLDGPLRLGFSAQLFVPSGERASYITDGTYRSVLSAEFAGESGIWNHAGYLGVHIRPRDDSSTLTASSLGGPRGSEVIFGLALAPEFAVSSVDRIGIGPEVFGESAIRGLFGKYTTALEAILSTHYMHTNPDGAIFRVKLGVGRGLAAEFGAPTWRTVVAVEISDRVGG